MFTGIIRAVGTIVERTQTRGGVRFRIRATKILRKLRTGSSVSVSGVCLTVERHVPTFRSDSKRLASMRKRDDWFAVTAVPQTLCMTTLDKLEVGDRVNLEPPLRVGDELGGHFVYGHVDGIGRITRSPRPAESSRQGEGEGGTRVRIWIPKRFLRYTVNKGSLAIDGVSLTIARKLKDGIEVALVPYTFRHTTLGRLKVGDLVNVEVDQLMKQPQAGSSK